MTKHRNDIYGDVKDDRANEETHPPAILAATVLLLREHEGKTQVLMLHKTSKISFGGMWVFPGGKIDADDYQDGDDVNVAARHAAARETVEEAGITIPQDQFIWFAHWTPPASTAKRFSTWFYITRALEDHDITIDGGEIQNHQWVTPEDALSQHAKGEIDLAPPTWVSLYHINRYDTVDEALNHFSNIEPRYYQTRVVHDKDDVRIALWVGDAGYEDWDPNAEGEKHRLTMHPDGFQFTHDAVEY